MKTRKWKALPIFRCKDCIYCIELTTNQDWCNLSSKTIEDCNIEEEIPEWCGLNDIEPQ